MSSDQILSDKQLEFILKSTAKWNLAHGSVRTGKTVGTLFRFMQAAYECPDSQIFMIGHTIETIYQNCVRLLLESPQLACFKPFCTYYPGKKQLAFHDKTISLLGAKDEGAISAIQGKTFSVVYCDEMALYPESIIHMIDTRLSNAYSIGFASMNPSHPDHTLKQWIDKAEQGDKNYYALHFTLDDNPFVSEEYKARIRDSLSGVFYKRNYLGLWCLAEGAIYDFFERDIHTVERPPTAAEYYICGIDYGTVNAFCALIIGVNSGRATQTAKRIWVEKEYYWDSKIKGRQKTNFEYAEDLKDFLEPYPIKYIYLDPSAEAFQVELRRKGFTVIHAKNDVLSGIQTVSNLMKEGQLTIIKNCTNTVREIQGYVWDPKLSARGYDEPLKKADHACVTGDTLVLTVDGYRPIKDLKEGKLINYNLQNQSFEVDSFYNASLTQKDAEIYEIEFEDGTTIRATADHKFLLWNGEYVQMKDLNIYSKLMGYRCVVGIKQIRKLDQTENVYCLATTNGNFIANKVIIKNCDALRYAVHSHRFTSFDAEEHYRKQEEKMRQQMYPNGYGFTNFR